MKKEQVLMNKEDVFLEVVPQNGYKGFVDIPTGWQLKKIKDISLKITDGTHDTPKPTEKGIPYITAVHVKDGNIDFNNCYYITEQEHEKIYNRCNPQKGDLLLVNIGAGTATPALVDVDFEFSMKNVALIKPNQQLVDSKFLEQYQIFVKERLFHRLTSGGAQPFLSLREIGELDIILPEIEEQRQISEILYKLDNIIELKEKLIHLKKQQKSILVHHLMTGKIRWNDSRKFSISDIKLRLEKINSGIAPDGYVKTRVGIIPHDWRVVHLSDKFDRLKRKNSVGNKNVLTISAQHGLISQRDFYTKSVASENLSNYYLLENGDFAYNKSYSNGYPYGAIKVLEQYDSGVVSPLYICFTPNKRNYCPAFYKYYFEAGLLNHEIHAIAQEGARNHGLLNISIEDFFNTYIVDFDETEMKKVTEIISLACQEIELLERELEATRQRKKGMMQLLLTGMQRVKW